MHKYLVAVYIKAVIRYLRGKNLGNCTYMLKCHGEKNGHKDRVVLVPILL